MARYVNRIILVGHAGRAPDVHERVAGREVGVTLCTSHPDADDERTYWHRLVFTGKLADYALANVRKGDRIYVEGRLEYDTYERDGVTIPTASIRVVELVLLSPRRDGQ